MSDLITAAKSARSAIRYCEKELRDLLDVLPELQPARRCLYALQGEAERLSEVIPFEVEKEDSSTSPQQLAFVRHVDKAIRFHRENQNDPHNISNAVIAALSEVKEAAIVAYNTHQDTQ